MGAQKRETGKRAETFSLIGGPLHRLGIRLHLARGGANPIPLGLVLGGGAWVILVALAVFEGVTHKIFSLALIGGQVRLLVAIPLFFLCEAWLDPRTGEFAHMIVRSGIVSEDVLQREIVRNNRRKDSWIAEAVCLFAAMLALLEPRLNVPGPASTLVLASLGTTITGWWYWLVCLTLFRFLLLRWLWRLCLWWYYLWRLERLDLHLVPTHPDGAGGLAYLEVVQAHFIPLVLAFSAVESASMAEQVIRGTIRFDSIYPMLAIILVVDVVLFLGPLLIFTPKLWASWRKGMGEYMSFAARYVGGFDRKWLRARTPPSDPLLGTPDLQSLADLGNSVNVVLNMRRVPASARLLRDILVSAVLPLLPLFLLKYPVAELSEKLFTRLFGA